MRIANEKLCEEGVLKECHKHIVEKGLTHVLKFLRNFEVERINIALRKIHDMQL